ncbi:SCO7613 C-terminal domain-containing membrane protein [Microcella sp.]|uniref:SCO7613 C-terminal domain-containing membrane protein n=1 Tax=Microcella sp. TaxID=1913979 RepID=UPI00391B6176
MRPSSARGTASFPRSPHDLRSTAQCPACFTELRAVVCQSCGLNLAHPLAAELASLSATIADELDARLRLIDRMRREPVTAVAAVPPAPPAPAAASEMRESAGRLTQEPTEVSGRRPRRSGIQIALVVVGIALLSVFALFGVIYVFIAYGVVARSVIIALASLATLIAASVLARRGLGATAEGLAALGTVVLVLDAWAVRRTDIAGLAGVPETGFWGGALLVVAVVAVVWARLGGHRSPLLVGANLIPVSAALLTVQLASDLPRGAAPSLAALAASAAAVVVLAAGARAFRTSHAPVVVEAASRTPLLSLIVAAVAAIAGVAMLSHSGWWWGAAVAVGVAFLTGVAAWLLARASASPADTTIAATLAVCGSMGLIAGLVIAAASTDSESATLAISLLAPATLVAIADVARLRTTRLPARLPLTATAISAAVLTALAATLALVIVLTAVTDAVIRADNARGAGADVLGVSSLEITALAGLAAVLVIVGGASRIGDRLSDPGRALPVAAGAGLVVALTAVAMPTWWALMTYSAVVSIGAAAAATLPRTRGDGSGPRSIRLGLSVAAVSAALVAVSLGWTIDGGWWVGIVIALVSLGIGRRVTTRSGTRATATAVSGLLVIASAPSIASITQLDAIALTLAVASLVVILGRLVNADSLERHLLSMSVLPVGLFLLIAQLLVAPTTASLQPAAGALVFLVAISVVCADSRRGAGRFAGFAVIGAFSTLGLTAALATAQTVRSVAALTDASRRVADTDLALAALSALAVLAVVGALTVRGRERTALDIGLVAVGVPATIVVTDGGQVSLALTVCTVLLLALAVSRDGLVGSQSPRRYLGWFALATATAALWNFLAGRGIDNPEPYTLPLAGALLAISVVLARVPTAGPADRRVSGPTIIAVSALAVAGIPLAALAGDGPVMRGSGVGVVATAIVLGVVIGRVHAGLRWQGLPHLLLGVAVVTQVVLAVSVTVRVGLEARSTGGAPVDVLLQVAAVLIVIMLVGTAAATWSTLSATVGRAVPRVVAATTAATAGAAALSAGVIGGAGAMEQVELITIPLALGLLLIGTVELDRRTTARSLPWLTPGFVALLVPTLVAVDVDGGVWRIAALGIAATIILIGGVIRRLQAPFLVGAIVLLVHAGIQTWPLIAAIGQSIEWWLWLGVAGVAIVAVAARYERRVQNVKNTVRRISELR